MPRGGNAASHRAAPVTAEVVPRRFRLASPAAAMALGALVLALAGTDTALSALGGNFAVSSAGPGFAALLVYMAVGVTVARHQPANPIGWLLLGFAMAAVCYGVAGQYAVVDYHLHHGDLPLGPVAALIASELWIGLFLMLPLVILLFPDGRLPSRWRLVLWLYLAVCALLIAALLGFGAWEMGRTRIVVDANGQLVPNRFPAGLLGTASAALIAAVAVFWALFVARQVINWRRANGERRAQLKWLMAGSAPTAIGLAGTFVFAHYSGPLVAVLGGVAFVLGLFCLPVGIGIGILKYRLYDIDRIISRTLAYTIVTGLLVGVYAGLVLLATRVLAFHTPVAVAAATLAAAALFNPLRRRVQQVVDRRFNRARYNTDQTIAAFAAHLRDAVDLDAVRADLAATVHAALEPAHISVWISQHD